MMALGHDMDDDVMMGAVVDQGDDQVGESGVAQDQPGLQLFAPLQPGRTECVLAQHRDALSRVVVR
jgi:hypothetical protein